MNPRNLLSDKGFPQNKANPSVFYISGYMEIWASDKQHHSWLNEKKIITRVRMRPLLSKQTQPRPSTRLYLLAWVVSRQTVLIRCISLMVVSCSLSGTGLYKTQSFLLQAYQLRIIEFNESIPKYPALQSLFKKSLGTRGSWQRFHKQAYEYVRWICVCLQNTDSWYESRSVMIWLSCKMTVLANDHHSSHFGKPRASLYSRDCVLPGSVQHWRGWGRESKQAGKHWD